MKEKKPPYTTRSTGRKWDRERDRPNTLTGLLQLVQRDLQLRIRVALPGTIEKYDAKTQRAQVRLDVLPLIIHPQTDELWEGIPLVLPSCPVVFPRTAAGYITFPIAPGDSGQVIVNDRDIGPWSVTGKPSTPNRLNPNDITDAVFYPGLHADTDPIEPGTGHDQTDVVVAGTNGVKLGGKDAALGVARTSDGVSPDAAMTAWALAVETAINALAPLTFTPANSFAGTVANAFANISGGSSKVKAG